MSVYILSVMSVNQIDKEKAEQVVKKLENLYSNEIRSSYYDYPDRKFKELDFDIRDIYFHKEYIHEEITKLIEAIEIIFEEINEEIEVIGGYNDTEQNIKYYEKDREGTYTMSGLFATRVPIQDGEPYYQSSTVTVYQSFEFDSMGVIF